jgi:hypothetical protein
MFSLQLQETKTSIKAFGEEYINKVQQLQESVQSFKLNVFSRIHLLTEIFQVKTYTNCLFRPTNQQDKHQPKETGPIQK